MFSYKANCHLHNFANGALCVLSGACIGYIGGLPLVLFLSLLMLSVGTYINIQIEEKKNANK